MKNKLNLLWLIAVIGFAAIACVNTTDPGNGTGNGNTHTHTYSSEWSSNATEHWKECTAADCDDKTETGQHNVSSWSFKAPADCITSEIEKGTCTVCTVEQERYSTTNKALGHTLDPLTKVSVSFGVFEDFCTRCEETHKHQFTYKIGDTGPAGGIIFYVADGEDSRPDGITIQGYGSSGDNGYFAEYTAYYFEAAPVNETNSQWGVWALIDGVTNFSTETEREAGLAASIGVGRKDTQTIVNSTAFAALTDTAAQRCASKSLNGFTDWFLPSLGELNEMYKAKGQIGIPTTGYFWSSSQAHTDYAYRLYFNNGNQSFFNRPSSMLVRAVRAF